MAPTREHWRAVGDAVEKFTGQGRWRVFSPVSRTLPPFQIAWDDPTLLRHEPDDGYEVVGSVAFRRDGTITLTLRSDVTPERLHENVLHELQHISDATLIGNRNRSREWFEERARQTADRLGRWP